MNLRLTWILFCLFFFVGITRCLSQDYASKKNILVIITDEQSADAMSCVIGNKYLHTPNMDYLAQHGVQFTRAYAANPLCAPSRSSMFTGRYPTELGVLDNLGKGKNNKPYPTLGTIFSRNEYATGYVGKWHILVVSRGDKAANGFQWTENNRLGGSDSLIAGSAVRFLQMKRKKPFLLVVSFFNPHNICQWARGERLPDGPIGTLPPVNQCPPLLANHEPTRNESDINRDMRKSIQANPKFPVGNFTDAQWREYRWAYYRLIEKADSLVGKVLNALRASGKMDNTLIVFLSDHGDMQGAHQWNQKTVFYEEATRVPFIFSGPGLVYRKSKELVNTGVDLIPTLCTYAGIKSPALLPGCNVLQSSPCHKYVVVSNRLAASKNIIPGIKDFKPEGRMVRGERFKYWIYDQGKQRESLFDIKNDPGEMDDLARAQKYRKVLLQHRKYLREWAESHHDEKAIEMLNFLNASNE
ncbi:MAG TPA: sulfatase-like hydrolase/transferase [Hanamia sp.]|nr:sulfatase-like hydrolase/transferase [Hanamia sp.]